MRRATRYLLDTDTASCLLRGRTPALDRRVASAAAGSLCLSAVTRGELLYALRLKQGATRLERLVEQLLARLPTLPWDAPAADAFADIAAGLHRTGTRIGSLDAMIAGHALAIGAVLVTNNVRHFARVDGLVVENWIDSGP